MRTATAAAVLLAVLGAPSAARADDACCLVPLNKLKITEVPINSIERKYGSSRVVKNPITYGFRVMLILIRTFRDYNPLLTFGIVGITMLLSSAAIYSYLFLEWLIFARPIAESPTSFLTATTILLVSIQILMFAFLADMIRGFREREEV